MLGAVFPLAGRQHLTSLFSLSLSFLFLALKVTPSHDPDWSLACLILVLVFFWFLFLLSLRRLVVVGSRVHSSDSFHLNYGFLFSFSFLPFLIPFSTSWFCIIPLFTPSLRWVRLD
ncbi:hypothetical protein BDW42DRAFT_24621 [Aspergillus taichungensis]|uniref:Uncharacterized protein n=1 Tax=Aspergillus taichungensis TaxID=482145 RepID=A0A2J5I4L6_9EURO|nr:hypothetical protein BDW42DRAFT_24621 [Aspergillus taichungensis]